MTFTKSFAGEDGFGGGTPGDDRIEVVMDGNGSETVFVNGADEGTYADTAQLLLVGLDGNDVIISADGGDHLFGGDGDDRLEGRGGNDELWAGEGVDELLGGVGDDSYYVRHALTVVVENAGRGHDTVYAIRSSFTLPSHVEDLVILGSLGGRTGTGNALDNHITGGSRSDTLYGLDGDDYLEGGSGYDYLYGGAGDDVLVGGDGRRGDDMWGDEGRDTFVFTSTRDSRDLSRLRDEIHDFVSGTDTIDLAGIDANTRLAGDQAFTLIGDRKFSGNAGELQILVGTDTLLRGDVDGDGRADFSVLLTGQIALTPDDLIL